MELQDQHQEDILQVVEQVDASSPGSGGGGGGGGKLGTLLT
jgi:hypothetical protein